MTMMFPMNSPEEIAEKLDSLTFTLEDLRVRAMQGDVSDMDELESEVIRVCDAVAKLSDEDARTLERPMATMISALESLAVILRELDEQEE